MPSTIAGDPDIYPETLDIPADGDARNASSVGVALEALTHRTANLKALKHIAGDITRTQKATAWNPENVLYIIGAPSDSGHKWTDADASPAEHVYYELLLPHGCVLDGVLGYFKAATTHAALPATLPKLELFKVTMTTGVVTSVGSVTDAPANVAAYEQATPRQLFLNTNETIDNTINRYVLAFRGEGDANSETGFFWWGVQTVVDMTELDEGAGT